MHRDVSYRDPREDALEKNTKCGASGKAGHWRGDAACAKNKNTENHGLDKDLYHVKVCLSESEDERGSPLQNQGMDSEKWDLLGS